MFVIIQVGHHNKQRKCNLYEFIICRDNNIKKPIKKLTNLLTALNIGEHIYPLHSQSITLHLYLDQV